MEIRKELPEVFEEFAEARKNSFLKVKELKEKGIPVVGSYCTYFPQELAFAAGAASVSLCSTSDETIPVAEKELPRNLCPLIKSSYGFAVSDKCPYFYFSDLVVGETTCDGKKKMFEYMQEFKDVFVMQLPNTQDEMGLVLWKNEIEKLAKYMEEKFGNEITKEKLLEAIKVNNDVRRSMKEFYGIMKLDPPPISGYDLFKVIYGSGFNMDRRKIAPEVDALREKVLQEYEEQKQMNTQSPYAGKPRIIITGCPIGGATEKVISAVEDNGGVVVGFESCSGAKQFDRLVSEDGSSLDDLYENLAERYLNIGCSVMSPDKNRFELLGRIIDEYKADGVVEMTLQACHTYNIEATAIKKFVTKEKDIPYIQVETDYSKQDVGQLNTRIAAFIEML